MCRLINTETREPVTLIEWNSAIQLGFTASTSITSRDSRVYFLEFNKMTDIVNLQYKY